MEIFTLGLAKMTKLNTVKRVKKRTAVKKGFTLIELLVVIAIIALLMAIIMPALNTAKQQAAGAVCLAHEKQVLTAWLLYAEENDSKICSPNTQVSSGERKGWILGPVRANGTPCTVYPAGDSTAEDEQRGIERGLLYPYYENYKLVHCPADKRFRKPPTNTTGSFTGDGGYRSYSFVLHAGFRPEWVGDEANWVSGGWLLKGKNELLTKTSQIHSAGSKYVLVEENDNRGYNIDGWVMDQGVPGLIDPFAVFHNMRSIMGFADGHAEKVVWKDGRTEAHAQEIFDGRNAFRTTSAEHDNNEDIQWLFSHYPRGK